MPPAAKKTRSRRITFRQGDLTRAIKAIEAAGQGIGRVEIEPDGKIVIVTTKATRQSADRDEALTADEELARWRRMKGHAA